MSRRVRIKFTPVYAAAVIGRPLILFPLEEGQAVHCQVSENRSRTLTAKPRDEVRAASFDHLVGARHETSRGW